MKNYLALSILVVLSGCGGGGEGGGTNSSSGDKSLVLTVTDPTQSLVENGASITVQLETNSKSDNYTLTVRDPQSVLNQIPLSEYEKNIHWSVNKSNLILSADELLKSSGDLSLTLTLEDGSEQISTNFSLDIVNTSLNERLEVASTYIDNSEEIKQFSELKSLQHAYEKVFLLMGHGQLPFTPEFDEQVYLDKLNDIKLAVSKVHNGGIETLLVNPLSSFESELNASAKQYIDHLNKIAAKENSLSVLPAVDFNASSTGYSFFKGNVNYGQFTELSVFKFNPEFQFVENLTDPTYGNCSISFKDK
ncbi:hypothetical protein ACXITX_21580 [Vibrio parahaemolyticus]